MIACDGLLMIEKVGQCVLRWYVNIPLHVLSTDFIHISSWHLIWIHFILCVYNYHSPCSHATLSDFSFIATLFVCMLCSFQSQVFTFYFSPWRPSFKWIMGTGSYLLLITPRGCSQVMFQSRSLHSHTFVYRSAPRGHHKSSAYRVKLGLYQSDGHHHSKTKLGWPPMQIKNDDIDENAVNRAWDQREQRRE